MVLLLSLFSGGNWWIPLFLIVFLVMVVLGQRLVNYIFQRFFNSREDLANDLSKEQESL
jgi:biopolymer transport protein ExbB/TolQ